MAGVPFAKYWTLRAIDDFVAEGWLIVDRYRLRATETGLARLNAILSALLNRPATASSINTDLTVDG